MFVHRSQTSRQKCDDRRESPALHEVAAVCLPVLRARALPLTLFAVLKMGLLEIVVFPQRKPQTHPHVATISGFWLLRKIRFDLRLRRNHSFAHIAVARLQFLCANGQGSLEATFQKHGTSNRKDTNHSSTLRVQGPK